MRKTQKADRQKHKEMGNMTVCCINDIRQQMYNLGTRKKKEKKRNKKWQYLRNYGWEYSRAEV